MKMKSTLIKLFMVVVVLSFMISIFIVHQAAHAGERIDSIVPTKNVGNARCWPLDVIVLVDDSGSMYDRTPYNVPDDKQNPPSDPDGYRYDAAEEILYEMISNRQEFCGDAIHRFGEINFAGEAIPIWNLIPINLSPEENPEAWSMHYREIISAPWKINLDVTGGDEIKAKDIYKLRKDQAFASAKVINKNNTDPYKAFLAAKQMFLENPASEDSLPLGYGERRHVVLLITDGKPEGYEGNEHDYFQKFLKEVKNDFWKDVSIWVLALRAPGLDRNGNLVKNHYLDEGSGRTLRQVYENITVGDGKQHKSQLIDFAYNEQLIPTSIAYIVNQEFGNMGDIIKCNESFAVDPYLQRIEFKFFHNKKGKNLQVRLSALENGEPVFQVQDGKVINSDSSGDMTFREELYKYNDNKEEYVFDLPRPGLWRFELESHGPDCESKISAIKVPIKAIPKLIQPEPGHPLELVDHPPYYERNAAVPFQIQLKSVDGKTIPIDKNFPINVLLEYKLPDEKNILPNGEPVNTVSLESVDDNGGLWSSKGNDYAVAPEIGLYPIKISGSTNYGNGQPGYVVFEENFNYEVKELEQFGFKALFPNLSENSLKIQCNQIDAQHKKKVNNPINVRIQVTDQQGNPTQPDKYLTTPLEKSFNAELLDSDGNILSSGFLKPSSELGVFDGSILNPEESFIACGQSILKISFSGDYARDRFTLPIKTLNPLTINREEAQGVDTVISSDYNDKPVKIHDSLWPRVPIPVSFYLELKDMDNINLNPEDVIKNDLQTPKKTIKDLYTIELIGPKGQKETSTDLNLDLKKREDGAYYIEVRGGTKVIDDGKYDFRVTPKKENFDAKYIPLNLEPQTLSFTRRDPFITSQTLFNIIRILIVTVILVVIAFLVWGFTGGPGGMLVFVGLYGTQTPNAIRLPSTRFFAERRNADLSSFGIKSIKASKGQPIEDLDPNNPEKTIKVSTAHLMIMDTNGDTIFDNDIPKNIQVPFQNGTDLLYQ